MTTDSTSHDHLSEAGWAKVRSRRWRWLNSSWLLVPAVGLGWLNWAAFGYVAFRTRRWQHWVAAGGYLAWVVALFAFPWTTNDALGNIFTGLILVIWLGGIVHGFVINPSFLRWKASDRRKAWYATAGTATVQPANPTVVAPVGTSASPAAPMPSSLLPAAPPPPPPPAPPAPERPRRTSGGRVIDF